MKNQFFADRRDFFKYDLLLEILEKAKFLQRLTLVPLLTAQDNVRGGELTRYQCGARRTELYKFLGTRLEEGKRDIRLLRTFFARRDFQYIPYRDSEYFNHQTRDEYFNGIPDSALQESLVFLDPDNGLEVPSMGPRNGDKYVRYAELDSVSRRMDSSSVLVVYQHLPRQDRKLFFLSLRHKLTGRLNAKYMMCVSDNSIAFVAVTKVAQNMRLLKETLESYAHRFGLQLPFQQTVSSSRTEGRRK